MGKRTPPVISLRSMPAPSGMGPLAWRQSFRLKCKASGRARGSLPEGAGAAQAASEGVNACQHNICPNLSAPRTRQNRAAGAGKRRFRRLSTELIPEYTKTATNPACFHPF